MQHYNPLMMEMNFQGNTSLNLPSRLRLPFRPAALLNAAPALFFSQYPTFQLQDMAVSMPTLLAWAGGHCKSIYELPMHQFILKMKPEATQAVFDALKVGVFLL